MIHNSISPLGPNPEAMGDGMSCDCLLKNAGTEKVEFKKTSFLQPPPSLCKIKCSQLSSPPLNVGNNSRTPAPRENEGSKRRGSGRKMYCGRSQSKRLAKRQSNGQRTLGKLS